MPAIAPGVLARTSVALASAGVPATIRRYADPVTARLRQPDGLYATRTPVSSFEMLVDTVATAAAGDPLATPPLLPPGRAAAYRRPQSTAYGLQRKYGDIRLSGTAPTGIAFVKNVGTAASVSGATEIVTVPASGVAAGNVVVVRCMSGGATSVTSIVDSKSNTYTSLHNGFGNTLLSAIWVGNIVTGLVSGDTITTTFSSAAVENIVSIEEFSGAIVTEDGTSADNTGSSTTPSVSQTVPTAGDLVIANLGLDAVPTIATPDSDTVNGTWVPLTRVVQGANKSCEAAYKIVTASGVQSWDVTLSATDIWINSIASIKAASVAAAFDPLEVAAAPGGTLWRQNNAARRRVSRTFSVQRRDNALLITSTLIYRWNGTTWVASSPQRWNGSGWVAAIITRY